MYATAESTWLLDPRWDDVPRLSIHAVARNCARVVVVAADPADAILALGATLTDLEAEGHDVTVVPSIDGHVDGRTLILSPAACDDRMGARRVAHAARDTGAVILEYPLRLWDSMRPSDVDWSRLRMLTPSLKGLQSKAAGPVASIRAHRVVETVLVPRADGLAQSVTDAMVPPRARLDVAAPFDSMYESGESDPWHLDDSAYERRRLAVVLACLGRTRYGCALDIGCATGQLSALLRARADEVVALDASERALDIARRRTDAVRWVLGAAPSDIPDAEFDLIVLSEIAYFLDGPELLATLRAVRRRLRRSGEIVIANWLRPTADIPLDGPTVHRQATAMLDLPLRARYEDADLMVQVWGEPLSVYSRYGGDL